MVNQTAQSPEKDSKLTHERIIAEAISLLESDGVAALSMRRLAASLGIRAPTLYWYFPDKGALMSGVMEALFQQCLSRIGPCTTWQEWMRAFGRSIWQVQSETPHSTLLVMSSDMLEEPFKRTVSRMHTQLQAFDLPLDELMEMQSAVQALMTGWSAFAQGRYADRIEQVFHLEDVAMHSLDAMIAGWDQACDRKRNSYPES